MTLLKGASLEMNSVAGFRSYQNLDTTVSLSEDNLGREGLAEIRQGKGSEAIWQKPCIHCGDCMSGCNTGAKNTLTVTYLPRARASGFEIYCRSEVKSVARDADGFWLIKTQYVHADASESVITLRAKRVVLSAGTLGTLRILFNSPDLQLSPMLGKKFHGNGDDLALMDLKAQRGNLAGSGPGTPAWVQVDKKERSGLSIQSALDCRNSEDPCMIEDLTVPSLFRLLVRGLVPGRSPKHLTGFLLIGKDPCTGTIRPGSKAGELRGSWPFEGALAARKILTEVVGPANQGKIIFPDIYPGYKRATAHPLGGVCMSDDPETGVTNAEGRLYDCSPASRSTYPGLYVADGSLVPDCLIANPLLTITALSEKIADHFIKNDENTEIFRIYSRPEK